MGVEWGNFYEDAIIRQQNLEQQEEQVAIDESLENTNAFQWQQESLESSEEIVKRQNKVDAILVRFEWLAEKEVV